MIGYEVQMLDDSGNVTEQCEAIVTSEAVCDDCLDGTDSGIGSGLQWTVPTTGITWFACWRHLAIDDYVNVKAVAL